MSEARGRRRGRSARTHAAPARVPNYRQLQHPFSPQQVVSDETVENIHAMALKMLEDLGIRVLHAEARQRFETAGALVNPDSFLVRIGRELIAEALATAPRSFRMAAANPSRAQQYEQGAMLFTAAGGCPNASDRERGRRPGSLRDFEDAIRLQQSFDVIHLLAPSAEPQDVPVQFRHYEMMRAQMTLSDKPLFVYARGRAQVRECLEMVRLGLDLTEDEFRRSVWATTVINTNSPRQIDHAMAEGIIDFALENQMSVITPFCLAGAMAPITIVGALTLQHAEALAGIALAQITNPGAPVSYGGFGSNVDMKSGAPAFGTPEHIKMSIGSGQLARYIDLPWRSAAGSASNTTDMQAAGENHMGLWAALQANATLTVHGAGWLEGGLTFGYEKFINDIESLQIVAELCMPVPQAEDDFAWSAFAEVEPGGHFFASAHTMERFNTAFYQPYVAYLNNFGTWSADGARDSAMRATDLWKRCLAEFESPEGGADAGARLASYIEAGRAAGGARPAD